MKRLTQIAKVILWAPLVLAAIPFVLVLFIVVGIPALIICETKAAVSLRVFRRREAGHVFLICTSRRGWHDFLRNNIIPVLPENFRVVWTKSARDGQFPNVLGHFARSRIFGVSKPYIVAVTPRALVHKSLNAVLQELKAHPKKSEDTQRACLEIINREIRELRTSP